MQEAEIETHQQRELEDLQAPQHLGTVWMCALCSVCRIQAGMDMPVY